MTPSEADDILSFIAFAALLLPVWFVTLCRKKNGAAHPLNSYSKSGGMPPGPNEQLVLHPDDSKRSTYCKTVTKKEATLLAEETAEERNTSTKPLEVASKETMNNTTTQEPLAADGKVTTIDKITIQNTTKADKEEDDSFAEHTPVKKVAKRAKEIESGKPVSRHRDDYKTLDKMSDFDVTLSIHKKDEKRKNRTQNTTAQTSCWWSEGEDHEPTALSAVTKHRTKDSKSSNRKKPRAVPSNEVRKKPTKSKEQPLVSAQESEKK